MFALKARKEIAILTSGTRAGVRSLLIAVILFNALMPSAVSTAAALSTSSAEHADTVPASVVALGSKGLAVKLLSPKRASLQQNNTATPLPTETPSPEPSLTPAPVLEGTPTVTLTNTPIPTQALTSSTELSTLSVELSATPNQAKVGDQVTFILKIVNHGQPPFTGLHFSNFLPEGFNTFQNDVNGFAFDEKTRELSWTAEKETAILAGESLILEYTVSVDLPVQASQIVDTASLMANELKEPVLVEASLTFSGADDFLTPLDSKGGEALGLNGQIEIRLPKDSLESSALVSIQDLKPASAPATDGEPWLVFELGLRVPQPQEAQSLSSEASSENDRAIPLEPIEAQFKEAVELSVSFDGLTDLATLGADQAPFLVTLDEASGIWVRLPLKSIDRKANRITAELTHFSTWGVGFGPSFPTNGAGVLLFDSAYPTLFTGRSKYSIPLWTPPGRNGMQPSLALSYSSGSVDGLLGDVQAPWVGMGWSIDTAEIARKITTGGCNPCGGGSYGYENKFMLLLNGTGYELLPDGTTAGRYHTKEESFLYIQLHNDSLGNNSPAATNATGEWWEVVEKDGTRWRLGFATDSEQLAAMKGYPGTNSGAWATLGYAGHATDVVALRWRADQVTDVYGNQMAYAYTEESRAVNGTAHNYDRASYVDTISYTNHPAAPALTAGYSVKFVLESRGTSDVPTTHYDWDNWDTSRLNHIDVKYGSTIVRTYTLGYTIDSQTDGSPSVTWQTTMLTSFATSGLGTSAPAVVFTYADNLNRAVKDANSVEWAYPRLKTISNGWGGIVTYTYANDGRDYTSWYNWKVTTLDTTDNATASTWRTAFTYSTPCYKDATLGWCNTSNAGELIGYAQATDTKIASDLITIRAITVHKFHTDEQKSGREYETQNQDPSGTTLGKTVTTYSVFTYGAVPGGYFNFVTRVEKYLLVNSSLLLVGQTNYYYDSATGNLTLEEQNQCNGAVCTWYADMTYQYVTNTSIVTNPAGYWILNTVWQKYVSGSYGTVSVEQYGYNGNLPGVGSPTTNKPDLSRLVSGVQTIDTKYIYDPYGNVTETRLFKSYGTTGSQPTGNTTSYFTSYNDDSYVTDDEALQTYPTSTTNPLGQSTHMRYNYSKGVPTLVTDPNDQTTSTTFDGLERVTTITYPGYAQPNIKYTYPTPTGTPLSVSAPFAVKMEIWDETASPAAYRSAWQIMDGLGRVIQTQGPAETAGNLILTDTAYNLYGFAYTVTLPRTWSATGGSYYAPNWATTPRSITSYDALQRLVSTTYPDTSVESFSYAGLRTTSIDRNNHQKVQETDSLGRLIKVEEYTGSNPYTLYATTQYVYNGRNQLTSITDAAGNQTTLIYDGFGRKTEMTDSDMGNWRYRYDPFGNLTAQIDAKRQAINLYYDNLNRMIGKTYTAGPVDPNTYQPPSDPGYDGYTVKNYYDEGTNGIGHRTSMVDPSSPTPTTWTYNVLGQVTNGTQNIDNTDYTISGSYDAFGRPLTQTLPSTEQLNYSYNAMGALLSLTGTNTYVSQIHYAASGQVTDELLGNGLLQQSCYNATTLRLTNLRTYPGAAQSCVVVNPANTRLNLSYTYQNNGNVSQIVDATRNETLSYTYDELDRLLSGGGLDNRSYTYGTTGNTASQNTALPNPGTTGLAAWWNLNEAGGTRNDSHAYGNHLNDINTVGNSAGVHSNAADFEKDNLEYLSRPSSAQLQMSTSDIYIGAWIKVEDTIIANPNVVSKLGGTNHEFNIRLQPSGVVEFVVYDAAGTGYSVASSTSTLTYGQWAYVEGWTDKANRTVYVNVNNGTPGSATWASNENRNGAGSSDFMVGARDWLGSIGNYWDGGIDEVLYYKRLLTPAERTWLYNGGSGRAYADLSLPLPSATTYYYDDPAHKHAVTSLSTGETYTYDANGNMITRVENGLTYTQTFNIENQLASVTVNGQTTTFVYDGDGNLVKKVKPDGSKTIYVGGIYEVDKTSSGIVTRTVTYYPAGGAMRIVDSTNNRLYYILKDHLGSASVVTDSTGIVVGEQRYYPYGETRITSGTIYTDKLFTGQREMAGLGIYHYGARFYSPYINRFLSPDTIVPGAANPQAFNRYSYVLNNPIRYNDPTGHMCSDPEDPSPTCDGSSLQSTKVGNKIVKGSGLDAGKPKNKPKKDKGNDEDPASTAPPTIDVQDLLLQHPGFDPFTGTYSNPNDYYGSGAEDIDLAFLALYDNLGIDIDYYAIHGLPNPLSLDQVPTEMQIRLIGPAQSIPLTFFLRELGLMTPDITTNYEPNYVYIAMLSHPDALVRAIDIYNTDVAPLTDKLQNLGPGDPPSP